MCAIKPPEPATGMASKGAVEDLLRYLLQVRGYFIFLDDR